MKHIFVGDVHGKVEAVKEALSKEGKKIFVGDFMDSFEHDVQEHEECLQLVLKAIEAGEAEACFGNHELSYLMPFHRCSGYTDDRAAVMRTYGDQLRKLFKPYIFVAPDFLVSHAGLTGHIWNEYRIERENLKETLEKWWENGAVKSSGQAPKYRPIHWIGRTRGGINKVGGLFWCHFPNEFIPVKGLKQVFGHTRGSEIRRIEDNWCIDCLDFQKNTFLELDL